MDWTGGCEGGEQQQPTRAEGCVGDEVEVRMISCVGDEARGEV